MSAPEDPRRFRYLSKMIFVAVVFALFLPALAVKASAADSNANPLVLELKLNGEVEPVLATYIDEGLADAAQRHAALVLITMDTPGGLSDSMTGYHPSHSGLARSRSGLCKSGWRARGFGGISDPAFSRYCGDGSGDTYGRCHADLDAQLGHHADGRSAAKEN